MPHDQFVDRILAHVEKVENETLAYEEQLAVRVRDVVAHLDGLMGSLHVQIRRGDVARLPVDEFQAIINEVTGLMDLTALREITQELQQIVAEMSVDSAPL